MRLFASIDLDGLTDEVANAQEPLHADGLNPTDPEQAHVTLKFFGDTDRADDLEAALADAVADADVAPFDATVGGYGVFPSPDYISVVWLGVGEGGEEMTRLHEAVERKTVERDFEAADHEFTPHVTLARMEHAANKERVRDLLDEDVEVGTTRVEEVRLTESVLTDEGPEYRTVARFPL